MFSLPYLVKLMSTEVVSFDVREKGIKNSPERFFLHMFRATGQVVELAEQYIKEEAPSSRLRGDDGGRGGITSHVVDKNPIIEGVVDATARNQETGFNFALVLYRGSGLYGPRKARIFPKVKKILAWVISGERPTTPQGWKQARIEGRARFARSVAGMKPNLFMDRGMKKAEKEAPAIFARELQKMNEEVS